MRANASIGFACSENGHGSGSLLRDADLATYAAKNGGKGTYMRYERGIEPAGR